MSVRVVRIGGPFTIRRNAAAMIARLGKGRAERNGHRVIFKPGAVEELEEIGKSSLKLPIGLTVEAFKTAH